ncbi:uncharacterized protein UHOD_00131 [Ustilago sp. UG-2017b]|nr:uncharacterized protein UHOD_00131 [Ustilago sp. UG-2017b]
MVPLAKTLAAAAAVLAAPALVVASSLQRLETRQYQDPNSMLVIDEPSCDFYQCTIYWEPGTQVAVNWINPPQGTVKIDVMTNNNSDVAYTVGTAPAISNTCDAGEGYGRPGPNGAQCGGFVFTVPSSWNAGNYSALRATNVENESLQSYTDKIYITKNSTTSNNAQLSIVSGSTVGGSSSTAAAAPPSSTSTAAAAATTTTTGSSGGAAPTGSASQSIGTANMTGSSARPSSTGQSGSNGAVGAMGSSATVLTVFAAAAVGLAGFL